MECLTQPQARKAYMADAHKNFAASLVATAPSPATSGTSLVVTAADGAKFPTAPFNATIWPVGVQPTTTNAEIVRVTAVSTDTLTITRTQESTSARTVIVGDQIQAGLTGKVMTDAETVLSGIVGGVLAASTNYAAIDSLEISATDTLEIPATSVLEILVYAPSSNLPYGILLPTIFSSQIQTFTNSGSWGGAANSFSYATIGGIKYLWGITAAQTSGAGGNAYTINFPTFFNNIISFQATAMNMTVDGRQYAAINSTTTSAATITIVAPNGAATSAVSIFMVGN